MASPFRDESVVRQFTFPAKCYPRYRYFQKQYEGFLPELKMVEEYEKPYKIGRRGFKSLSDRKYDPIDVTVVCNRFSEIKSLASKLLKVQVDNEKEISANRDDDKQFSAKVDVEKQVLLKEDDNDKQVAAKGDDDQQASAKGSVNKQVTTKDDDKQVSPMSLIDWESKQRKRIDKTVLEITVFIINDEEGLNYLKTSFPSKLSEKRPKSVVVYDEKSNASSIYENFVNNDFQFKYDDDKALNLSSTIQYLLEYNVVSLLDDIVKFICNIEEFQITIQAKGEEFNVQSQETIPEYDMGNLNVDSQSQFQDGDGYLEQPSDMKKHSSEKKWHITLQAKGEKFIVQSQETIPENERKKPNVDSQSHLQDDNKYLEQPSDMKKHSSEEGWPKHEQGLLPLYQLCNHILNKTNALSVTEWSDKFQETGKYLDELPPPDIPHCSETQILLETQTLLDNRKYLKQLSEMKKHPSEEERTMEVKYFTWLPDLSCEKDKFQYEGKYLEQPLERKRKPPEEEWTYKLPMGKQISEFPRQDKKPSHEQQYLLHEGKDRKQQSKMKQHPSEKDVKEITEIMTTMKFEIFGLLKQTRIDYIRTSVPKHPKLAIELQMDLLRIPEIIGCGTVYGQLVIHMSRLAHPEGPSDSIKNKVKQLLEKHNYTDVYSIELSGEIKESSRKLYKQGDETVATSSERKKEEIGTLGCFVNVKNKETNINKLFGITCAHCIENFDAKVTIISDNEIDEMIGTRSHCVYWESSVDIAAIEITEHNTELCDKSFIKNDKIFENWIFHKDGDLTGLKVYKRGTVTGFTQGYIHSPNYLLDSHIDDVYKRVPSIAIRRSNEVTSGWFAAEGDSGSVAWVEYIGPGKSVPVVTAIGIVFAITLGRKGLTFCCPIYRSIQELERQFGQHFKIEPGANKYVIPARRKKPLDPTAPEFYPRSARDRGIPNQMTSDE